MAEAFLHSKILSHDLGLVKYFLGIEFHCFKNKQISSQSKYVLDLLSDHFLTLYNLFSEMDSPSL